MSPTSWYRSWFDSPYYHLLYNKRDDIEAADFITQILKYFRPSADAHFLDLACGRGRHSVLINERGYRTTGLDLSEPNIAEAKKHQTATLDFHVHDMRLPFREKLFDYALNLFTSFGYFASAKENLDVVKALHQDLKPKGKLLIDFLNVNEVADGLVRSETQIIEGVRFEIARDMHDGFINKRIRITDGSNEHLYYEQVSALTKQDFVGMLGSAGFEILDIFGNYSLAQFDAAESPRLIIIARKI